MNNPNAPPTNPTTPRCALSRGAHPRFWAPQWHPNYETKCPALQPHYMRVMLTANLAVQDRMANGTAGNEKKGGVEPRARWWGRASLPSARLTLCDQLFTPPFEVRKGGCCNGSRTAMLRTRKLCWQAIPTCKPDSSARVPRGSRRF